MPRLGRLWRSGGRRAQVTASAEAASAEDAPRTEAPDDGEIGRRLEEARERLRQTIPPPQDAHPDEPQT